MAFSAFRNPLKGSLQKIGEALSTSVGGPIANAAGFPVAIDFGTSALKVLQMAPGDPPSLVAAACLDTPDNLILDHKRRLEFQLDALPRLVRDGGFKGKRAVCAIPAWKTFCKQIQVGKAEGPMLAASVQAAVPVQLGCDPASIVYRFIEVSPTDKSKSDVLLIGVGRDLVERLMKAVASTKLQPVGMHSEFTATLHAFDDIHRRTGDENQNTLYLDLGATTTKVMISHGKELAFARVIEIGGFHLDRLLSEQLECEVAEARRRRLELESLLPNPNHAVLVEKAPSAVLTGAGFVGAAAGSSGGGSSRPVSERRSGNLPRGFTSELLSQPPAALAPDKGDLREPLENLTDEILMCLRYHASQSPGKRVDRAVFVGGEARARGLCQHIARALRLPAHMADPLTRVARTGQEPALGVDLKQPQPGWAMVMGLSLAPTDL